MRYSKKIFRFILPSLSVTPIIAVAGILSSCGQNHEDQGIEATKVNVFLEDEETKQKTALTDQIEFDIQQVKRLKLTATVEPAEANQDVVFKIVDQEGTGNIACSQKGVIYSNGCVGTIKIKAISNTKNKKESDVFELVFYDSSKLEYQILKTKDEKTNEDVYKAYAIVNQKYFDTITEVVIPSYYVDSNGSKYDVAGVGYSGFNGCSKLWYVHLPKNNSNFYYIGAYAFYQCNKIKKIDIPNSVSAIDVGAFQNCASLLEAKLSENLEYISADAFQNCVGLEEIFLPNKLKMIGSSAFYGCGLIKYFNIPKTVTVIGESAFSNCWASTINVDPDNEFFITDSKALYSKDATKEDKIGDRLISCQYSYRPKLGSKYIIPDQITRIDARAFEYCDKVREVEFTENSQCTSIGECCFALCSAMTNITLPKNLTEIKSDTFAYCWNLKEIEIPEEVQYIGRDAFYGCDALASAKFVDCNKDKHEPCGWTVISTAVQPEYKNEYSTNWYLGDPDLKDIEDPEAGEIAKGIVNANKLVTYGNYKDPKDPSLGWEGGYGNCTWIKNSAPVDLKELGEDVTYIGPNYINRKYKTFTFTVKFNKKIEESDNKYIYLESDYEKQVSTEKVKLVGDVGQTQPINFDLTEGGEERLSKANRIFVKIS